MTLAEYEALLATEAPGATYSINAVTAYSGAIAAGQIISVSPGIDALVVPDVVITVVISLGALPASRWGGTTPELAQAAVEAISEAGTPAMIFATMAYLAIPGDPTYISDAGATLEWGGNEYIGVGPFGALEGPVESLDVIADPVRLTLSGADPALAYAAQNTRYQGKDAIIYMGILDPHTLDFVNEPTRIWRGFMDVMTVESDRNQAIITLDCTHRLRRLPTPRRMTDEDQRSRHPTDKFFQFLHEIKGYRAGAGGRSINYTGPGRTRERDPRRPD